MSISRICIMLLVLGFSVFACVKAPDYPQQPVISNVILNSNVINQASTPGSAEEFLVLTFDFTDGDGDIGKVDPETQSFIGMDLEITDSRTGIGETINLPEVPAQGTANGISGEISIELSNKTYICCTYPDFSPACLPNAQFPTDTFSYTIQLRDQAGNFSNKLQTEVITVLCN